MPLKDYKPTKYFRTPASEGGKILKALFRAIKNRKKSPAKTYTTQSTAQTIQRLRRALSQKDIEPLRSKKKP